MKYFRSFYKGIGRFDRVILSSMWFRESLPEPYEGIINLRRACTGLGPQVRAWQRRFGVDGLAFSNTLDPKLS